MLQRPVAEASSRRPGRTGRTQLKLFNAAMEIMTQKGLEYATVEEVAARAGVSKGTVYYNFGSKKTMVDQLVQYGTQLLLSDARRAASVHSDPCEALRSATRAAFQYLEDRPGFTRLWLSEAWKGADGWTEAMSDNRLNLLNYLEEMTEAVARRYTVDTAQNPRAIAISMFGAIYMLAMDREVHQAERNAEDATRAVMLVVDGYIRH